MKITEFDYYLPKELIAQHPLEQRDKSRLLYVNRKTKSVRHMIFSQITELLNPNDCLILNDSRVIPARIYGKRADTKSDIEFLLLKPISPNQWEVLCKPGKKAKIGTSFVFGELLTARIIDITEDGNRIAEFVFEGNIYEILEKIGQMPLPHYITEKLKDRERYQTVYAKEAGSAAAPTAGLHFTPELLERIRDMGVSIGYVTLHVGLGTFRPVKVENIEEHKMHSEHIYLPEKTAELINHTKRNNGRVICVGTTSCRTIESVARQGDIIREYESWTDIFIYPGFEFKATDGLITNFHLPQSSLIMLVSAFLGHRETMEVYRTAIAEKYRFFSFGDSMIII